MNHLLPESNSQGTCLIHRLYHHLMLSKNLGTIYTCHLHLLFDLPHTRLVHNVYHPSMPSHVGHIIGKFHFGEVSIVEHRNQDHKSDHYLNFFKTVDNHYNFHLRSLVIHRCTCPVHRIFHHLELFQTWDSFNRFHLVEVFNFDCINFYCNFFYLQTLYSDQGIISMFHQLEAFVCWCIGSNHRSCHHLELVHRMDTKHKIQFPTTSLFHHN